MLENFKKVFKLSIITSIFFIIVGLFLFIKPETTITTISYIIGSIIMFIGITFLIKCFKNKENIGRINGDLFFAILSLIFGLLIILKPNALASIIPFVLGIWIVVSSITKIQYALELKNCNSNSWIATFIIAMITFVWGVILLFNPFAGALVITKIIGLFIIVYAVLDLLEVFVIKKNINNFNKDIKNVIDIKIDDKN